MSSIKKGMRAAARFVSAVGFSLFLGLSQVQAQPAGDDGWGKEKPYGWGAQAPDTKQKLTCLVANDFYIVHFTSYLEPVGGGTADRKKAFKSYCQDLPRLGKAYLTIDLMDRDARGQPVGVKVMEMVKDGQPVVLTEVAPKVYPNGVVEAQTVFDKAGTYSVNLAFDDAMSDEDVLKIPLRVGLTPEEPGPGERPGIPLEIPIWLTVLGVVGFFAYQHIQRRGRG